MSPGILAAGPSALGPPSHAQCSGAAGTVGGASARGAQSRLRLLRLTSGKAEPEPPRRLGTPGSEGPLPPPRKPGRQEALSYLQGGQMKTPLPPCHLPELHPV